MEEEKCDVKFKAISKLENVLDAIVANNLSHKKIADFFLMKCNNII